MEILVKANEQIKDDVVEALKQGYDVVLEHTLYKAKRRITYMEEFKKYTDFPIIIFVVMPSDEQLKRNMISSLRHSESDFYTLKREMNQIEMPNIAEGYEKIYIVKDEMVEELITEIDTGLIERVTKELAEEETKQKEYEKLLDKLNKEGFWHYCEVCGKKEFLKPEEAYKNGWDYPPKLGVYGVIGPRKCGECGITDTLWWKITTGEGKDLTEAEQKTMGRILFEPYSLLEE